MKAGQRLVPEQDVEDARDGPDDEQQARPAADVAGAVHAGVLGRELDAGLVGGDDLVLGAVVLEQPLHRREPADGGG